MPTIMTTIGNFSSIIPQALLNLLLQTTVLVGAGLLAGRLLRKSGSAVQAAVYRFTLFSLFLCPLATLFLSGIGITGWTIRLAEPYTNSQARNTRPSLQLDSLTSGPANYSAQPQTNTELDQNESTTSLKVKNGESGSALSMTFSNTAETSSPSPISSASQPKAELPMDITSVFPASEQWVLLTFYLLISILWGFVSFWMIIRLVIAHRRLTETRRRSLIAEAHELAVCHDLSLRLHVRAPQVLISPELLTPCLAGFLSPAILLPEGFRQPIRLEAAIVHELGHLRRRDNLWNLAQNFMICFLFFQPLLWLLKRRLEATAEEVCDDIVVHECTDSLGYARQLLDLATENHTLQNLAGVGMFRCQSELRQRIVRILDKTRKLTTKANSSAITLMGIVAFGCTALASLIGSENGLSPTWIFSRAQSITGDDPWIRGTGENLELRLWGWVIDIDGQPCEDAQIAIVSYSKHGREMVSSNITDGNKFSAWLPVNRGNWGIEINCSSPDGKRRGAKSLSIDDLRMAASEGVEMRLAAASRKLEVRAAHQGAPVANAQVKMKARDSELTATTGEDGNAVFTILPDDAPLAFTAWTQSGLIGGYQFARGPSRDATLNSHEIELFPTRPLTIRLIDSEDNSPVVGVKFYIEVATPRPHFNYLGQNDSFKMVSDAHGEARFTSFPDWPNHHAYIESIDDNWLVADDQCEIIDDVLTVGLKKKDLSQRRQVTGSLALPKGVPGGFLVRLASFNGERSDQMDLIDVIADEEGNFSANVLPDVVYCIFVKDPQYVSQFEATILFDSTMEESKVPILQVAEGVPVIVRATAGSAQTPISSEYVSLFSEFEFKFTENGKLQNGRMHRQVTARTDNQGFATLVAPPGPLRASIHVGDWNGNIETDVVIGKVTRLEFHKPNLGKFQTTVTFLTPDDQSPIPAGSTVSVRSLDKNSRESHDLKTDENGQVAFASDSSSVAIYAKSVNGESAIVKTVRTGEPMLEIPLLPAKTFTGRLRHADNSPGSNYLVELEGYLSGDNRLTDRSLFKDTAETDSSGEFKFNGVPVQCACRIWVSPAGSTGNRKLITDFFLELNEVRPLAEYRLEDTVNQPPSTVPMPVAQRFDVCLRDSRLGNFNVLAIAYIHENDTADFVQSQILDHDLNPLAAQFLDFPIPMRENSVTGKQYFEERNWKMPQKGEVFVCAFDTSGRELEKITVNWQHDSASQQIRELMERHQPPQADALQKWEDALAEAARTNRRVFVQLSQRYCAPCFELSRWLDDHRVLLERDYVMIKIDDVRDTSGIAVSKMICGQEYWSIPFFAIFDHEGNKLIDSAGPLGNIGFPSSFDGIKHFKKMLRESSNHLTPDEIEEMMETLK